MANRPTVSCTSCGEQYELRPHQRLSQPRLICTDCDTPTVAALAIAPPAAPKRRRSRNPQVEIARLMIDLIRTVEDLDGKPALDLRQHAANYFRTLTR